MGGPCGAGVGNLQRKWFFKKLNGVGIQKFKSEIIFKKLNRTDIQHFEFFKTQIYFWKSWIGSVFKSRKKSCRTSEGLCNCYLARFCVEFQRENSKTFAPGCQHRTKCLVSQEFRREYRRAIQFVVPWPDWGESTFAIIPQREYQCEIEVLCWYIWRFWSIVSMPFRNYSQWASWRKKFQHLLQYGKYMQMYNSL